MEQTNYQGISKKLFSEYISDPSAIGPDDAAALGRSLQKFPYCQLLNSFYLRSLSEKDTAGFDSQLGRSAMISPDRMVLYRIINEAEKLKGPALPILQDEQSNTEAFEEPEENLTNPVQAKDTGSIDANDIPAEISAPAAEAIPENDVEPESDTDEILEEETSNAPKEAKAADTFNDVPLTISDTPAIEEKATSEDEELEKLIAANAVQTDYLAGEDIGGVREDIEDISENNTAPVRVSETEDKKVSKYHDTKLPYSFLWWLDKTRKEHSETYQPYVDFKLDTSQGIRRNSVDQLSSQIIENIFHLQSPVAGLENAPRTVPFQVKRKEDYILEKFIKDEPHINAPDSQKLDTENKARKSAEDPNDLVSETLAQVYTDQMLFHKAMDTYKKLSLKFPEKSTYFADQIRELEKKIN